MKEGGRGLKIGIKGDDGKREQEKTGEGRKHRGIVVQKS